MRRNKPFRHGLMPAVWMSSVLACSCRTDAPRSDVQAELGIETLASKGAPGAAHAPGTRDTPERYPPGAWRSAPPAQLDHTLLWISHILIRHDEVNDFEVSFTRTGWQSTQPRVTRTRREALELANKIIELARHQGNFASLAGQFSEDPQTATRGGSLGSVSARHFAAWPHVLDAISTLKPNDVSEVVSTQYGYHVLYRHAPPPKVTVSGDRIVIGHSEAPWLRMAVRGAAADRSREEALAIATRIYEQARAAPDEFAQLVAAHSEHRDAARGGDFGTWSTHERTCCAREVETLTGLEVGAVAEPVDTMFGYQVIRRTPNRPRARYAVSEIQLRFDAEAPDAAPASRAAVHEQALQLAAMLRRDSTRFEALQRDGCCTEVREVIEGRELPGLEAVLAKLRPGQIAPEPVADGFIQYLIPRRLELEALPEVPETSFELPTAQTP